MEELAGGGGRERRAEAPPQMDGDEEDVERAIFLAHLCLFRSLESGPLTASGEWTAIYSLVRESKGKPRRNTPGRNNLLVAELPRFARRLT